MTMNYGDDYDPFTLPAGNHEDLTIADIVRAREIGAMQTAMSDEPRYVLLAYVLHPNGTTGDVFIQDPEAAAKIGEIMGIGKPTDPLGWGVWEVPSA